MRLVPLILADTFSTLSIAAFIAGNGSLMVLDSTTKQYGVGRLFSRVNPISQNGISCRVAGLTLLRKNKVLDHSGFFVSSGSELKITVSL